MRATIAVLAIIGGGLLAVLLFVPHVARQYRRRGEFGLGRAVLGAALLVYVLALVGYVTLPLPTDLTALCARGGIRPQLQPLYVLGDIARSRTGSGLGSWLRSPPMLPLLFNIALFVPLGMFVRHLWGRGRVLTIALGLGVSLLVECTQLTGIWFLFPCAYRQFNVDDLLANTLGTALGVLVAPVLRLIDPPHAARRGPRPVTVWRRWLGMLCDWLASTLLGMFLGALPAEAHLLATGRYLDPDTAWYRWMEPALAWWLPGLLLFVLPALLGAGGSVGQRCVLLCPVRPDGSAPRRWRRLARVALGTGGYALLGGLVAAGVDPYGVLFLLLCVFVLASVLAALPTRGHRGLSLALTGLILADRVARVESPSPHDQGDSMVEPILTAIATTLATKTAGGLYELVKKAFHRHPEETKALEAAAGAEPDSPEVSALAEALARVEAAEPEFGERLRAKYGKIEVSQLADHGGVNSQVTGTVTGTVVQAKNVSGGINIKH